MNNDVNITVISALITTLAAIIAPVITALIQLLKEYKLKRLELSYFKKTEALKKFTEAFYKLPTDVFYSLAASFQKCALDLAVLCRNADTRNSLIQLADLVMQEKKRTEKIERIYNSCIKKLFKEL